jgi:hypothetical protein
MDSKVKFEDKELEELKEVRDGYEAISFELGQVELQKIFLEEREKEIKQKLSELKQQEQKQAEELQNKYGVGALDIETGEFTPA